jgi:hypothetical protein
VELTGRTVINLEEDHARLKKVIEAQDDVLNQRILSECNNVRDDMNHKFALQVAVSGALQRPRQCCNIVADARAERQRRGASETDRANARLRIHSFAPALARARRRRTSGCRRSWPRRRLTCSG